jgi:CheY-like chemotaxis protein
VDDEPDMIELVQLSLEENGYRVLAAIDGLDARFKLQNQEI